jgi:hypothetical protein
LPRRPQRKVAPHHRRPGVRTRRREPRDEGQSRAGPALAGRARRRPEGRSAEIYGPGALEATEDVQYRAIYAAVQSSIFRAQGRPEEALEAAWRSIWVADKIGWKYPGVKAGLVQAAEAAFATGVLAQAEEVVSLIEGLNPGDRTPFVDAQRARFAARLAAARGQDEGVAAGFKSGAGLFREVGMPFWLAVTLLEHGEWLAARGRGAAAEPLVAEAREIFERLRAEPWLERVRRLDTAGGVPMAMADATERSPI